ncbi:hypothetical protein [Marinomonas primoryensis]|uniref:Putative transmembrane protein n=1 Tax=Marinomonas primoryensis TaxID=178399 RepID=A0A859CWG2_9GAMM|nr:hypothetical protein [Marinomonas primoryensis]QKK80937.1 putative transmembrane protein [Marinomonas primoryensis]
MINSFANDLIRLFFASDFKVYISSFDSFQVKAKVKAEEIFYPNVDELFDLFKLVEGKNLQISFGGFGSSVRFSTNKDDYSEKMSELKQEVQALDDDELVEFELEVLDLRSESSVDIFDKTAFFLYLSTLNAQTLLEEFSKFSFDGKIEFRFWEDMKSFNSESIFFISTYSNNEKNLDFSFIKEKKRKKVILDRAKISHFVNAKDNFLIPDDFKIINGDAHNEIAGILNGILGVLCLTFISDFSSIHDDDLEIQIKGYKKVLDKLSFSEMKVANHDEIYNVYSWAYSEGSFVDKIGVARNVMSIHLVDGRLLNIENGLLDSILSGYDLYLKENVKQYIEIKNKINDFLYGQSDKALDLTKSVFSTVKAGIWTFMTFFVTVFLLRAISGKSLGGAISYEVLLVAVLLVIISSIYFCVSIFEINVDKKRLLERYDEVRNRYKDLLNESDLNKIINVNSISQKESTYIDKKRNLYCLVWFLICFFTLATVFWLYKQTNDVAPLPANTNIESEEIILNLESAHINFSSDKDGSFLTPANR